MKLGTRVGHGPDHLVSDGDPTLPTKKEGRSPIYGPGVLWPNGWMVKMPLGTDVGLGPGDIVLDGTHLPKKGHSSPNFRPMSITAKRSPISATAEQLLCHPLGCMHVATVSSQASFPLVSCATLNG